MTVTDYDIEEQTWLEERKIEIVEELTVVNSSIKSVVLNGQSYSLDTSQSRLSKSSVNLTELRKHRDSLLNELATINARLHGGTVVVRPGAGW